MGWAAETLVSSAASKSILVRVTRPQDFVAAGVSKPNGIVIADQQ
jgi:hypothetical protein